MAKHALQGSRHRLKATAFREVPGRHYGTPKELWSLTLPAQKGSARQAAEAALRANSGLLGLDPKLCTLNIRHTKQTLGGWHVIFGQRHFGTPIHRAYVTVHMSRRKEVYLIKNRAVPVHLLPPAPAILVSELKARRIAVASAKATAAGVLDSEPMWFPVKNRLRYAHRFRIRRDSPAHEWIIFVDAANGRILSKYDNISSATGRARVFNPNPVVALKDWRPLLSRSRPVRRVPPAAYESVTIKGIARSGRLDGPWVTTRPTRRRLKKPSLDFELQSHQRGFEEVMAYYHVDQAVAYLLIARLHGPAANLPREGPDRRPRHGGGSVTIQSRHTPPGIRHRRCRRCRGW